GRDSVERPISIQLEIRARRSLAPPFMVPRRESGIVEALHEPPLSRPSATLSPPGGERAGRGVPIWFMVPMHAKNERGLSMNLVAADVSRRTWLLSRQRISADSRRRLRFRGSIVFVCSDENFRVHSCSSVVKEPQR